MFISIKNQLEDWIFGRVLELELRRRRREKKVNLARVDKKGKSLSLPPKFFILLMMSFQGRKEEEKSTRNDKKWSSRMRRLKTLLLMLGRWSETTKEGGRDT